MTGMYVHTEAKGKEAEESNGVRAQPPTEVSRTRLLLLLLLLLLHFSRQLCWATSYCLLLSSRRRKFEGRGVGLKEVLAPLVLASAARD